MSKILNDSELQEIHEKLRQIGFMYTHLSWIYEVADDIMSHIDALAASLDAEAAAHSVTRAALLRSPEWVDSPGGGNSHCPLCRGYQFDDGHVTDCLRQVALYGENWMEEIEDETKN